MKCSIILLTVFFIIFCESNFKCAYWDDKMKMIEFYYTGFKGNVPLNCSALSSPANLTERDKLKVETLKIGGYDIRRINGFIQNYPNLYSLDVSYSKNERLSSMWIKQKNLTKLNMSHCRLERRHCVKYDIPNLTDLDLSYNKLEYVGISITI